MHVKNFIKSLYLTIITLVELTSAGFASPNVFFIHWNTTNPIFRIDNTDHIFDVNRNIKPFEYDQANIICPISKRSPFSKKNEEDEQYIIYNVSKEEYESCRITNPNPRIIAMCNRPHEVMFFTITFRSFTPTPGGLEFRPGHDYYFISTSSSDDLHRRVGGRCATNNMKVVFKVHDPEKEYGRVVLNQPRANGPFAGRRPSSPSSTTPKSTSTTTLKSTTPKRKYFIPTFNFKPVVPKKSDEYQVHPNDVIKQEASTSIGGSPRTMVASLHLLALSALLPLLSYLFNSRTF